MNSKIAESSSFIQILIDKYIYYVVINKSHKKYILENLGYDRSIESILKVA
jgi:hypothetical protein